MRFHLFLLFIVLTVLIWSGTQPYDRLTWAMEVAPVAIALPVFLATYARFRFTDLAYGLIAIHCVILMIGGKYTYAEVPLFNWIRDALGLARNHYDRVGHFAQGFIPAIVFRELLIRTTPLRPGKWMFFIIVFGCLGVSATYELIEWTAAEVLGDSAEAFLGTQGDVWDTQKDMALAGIGAIVAQLVLARVHDRQLGGV